MIIIINDNDNYNISKAGTSKVAFYKSNLTTPLYCLS